MTARDITQAMKELYESGLSLEEVGNQFGMTRQGVRDRFVKAGIACRPQTKYKHIDKERLRKLYSDEKLPLPEIADVFSVGVVVVRRALKYYAIPRRVPLKKGGYIVDFLRSLELGEKDVIKWRDGEKYAHLHHTAKLVGIKISIRSRGGGKFEVTRLE